MTADREQSTEHIDIRYVAGLARIYLSDRETRRFESQLDDVLEHVQQLQQLDVSGVEPTAHALPVRNVWRGDEPAGEPEPEPLLNNAPSLQGREVRVPRIVE
jgi:aspartyl-tRNA(Asn)/glutamyl-tRNA(Gln) amidotransferase subunit C